MKNYLNRIFTLVLFTILINAISAHAQRPVRMGPAPAAQIKKALAVVKANMDSMDAHKDYIYAMGLTNPLLIAQYDKWMKEYPQNVVIPLAIGTVYYDAEMPQARQFLLKAVQIDPKNAKIWFMLSIDAELWGKDSLSTEYLHQAALADPANVDYATYYLTLPDNNAAGYAQKVFSFVKRFPASEVGARALYWLAEDDTVTTEKIRYFEMLRKLYPPQKFRWSTDGMLNLTDVYLKTSPEKALNLLRELKKDTVWTTRTLLAESLIKVKKLEQEHRYQDAVAELNQARLPNYNEIGDFIALKKSALLDEAGDVKAAYDSLTTKFAKLPTDVFYAALLKYANKIGKSPVQVDKDIENIRNSSATPAYPFDLGRYDSDGKLNLKDLRGKVVLLTFWFPGCGPCRDEFPHFEAVINKFKGKKVVYVGINVDPYQDPYVLPLMKNAHYTFIPLRGSNEFAKRYYGVDGDPTNFLIDQNGNIIFKDFRIDGSNQRTLEMMIDTLLNNGAKSL